MLRPYASSSGAVSVATTNTVVAAANANRRELTITNDGANIIYLQLQTTGLAPVAVANQGVRLAASGGSWTTFSHSGAVAGIALTGATVVTVVDI